jgi:hypothetical protein
MRTDYYVVSPNSRACMQGRPGMLRMPVCRGA